MQAYLRSTEVIDWRHPAVVERAEVLREGGGGAVGIARRCFEWVRDAIKHTGDCQLLSVNCAASEVLREGSGYCYAKSHLLAALWRANGLPAGLCYQRLCLDEEGSRFCLHGLAAVMLPEYGWYRADPRGNRAGIDAQFTPPTSRLAFAARLPGEADLPNVYADPLPVVVQALRAFTRADLLGENLPDLQP